MLNNTTRITLAAAATALALAAAPALAQTTKDMGKDSSMGTTSDAAKGNANMMKKDSTMGMKKDTMPMKKDPAGNMTRGEDNSGKTTSGMTQGK